MAAPAAGEETAPPTRPTFTARSDEPPTAAVPEPASALDDTPEQESAGPEDADSPSSALGPDDGPDDRPDDRLATEPDIAPDAGRPSSEPMSRVMSSDLASTNGDRPGERPLPTVNGLDEPLLGDVAALRGRWQRVQADFVDDPKEAVGDAADLIEQTAQALVGALRQRQRELRVLWERGPVTGTTPAGTAPADGESAGGADTEHLRQLMQRYRALFNQLARP